jgi:hypothetical protein
MDFSRLNRRRAIMGAGAAVVLVLTLLFIPWYSLSHNPARDNGQGFICGTGDYSCTGFETFPIMRWLLLLAASAPIILAWIIVRGHKLSWPPGELTMTAGSAATVLIGYNGLIDKPGTGISEIGVSLDIGYWIALVAAVTIAVVGFLRSMESGARQGRKAPGTV